MRLACATTLLLVALTQPTGVRALEFPMPLDERVQAAEAIVVGRVRHQTARDTGEVILEIKRRRLARPEGRQFLAAAEVPRQRATVEIEQTLKGSCGKSRIRVHFGAEGQPAQPPALSKGARVLLFLRRSATPGTWQIVNEPFGAVGIAGGERLRDGSTLAELRQSIAAFGPK